MKRDKLYTVNKWNQPLFADVDRRGRNIFDGLDGSLMQRGVPIASGYNPQFKAPDTIDLSGIIQKNAYNDYLNSSGNNWFGISKKNNPLSKVNISTTAKAAGGAAAAMGSQIGVSERNKRGMYDTLDPVHQLAGGRESGVGNAFGDAGVGLFQAGASSGNPWLMAAGAAAKIVGGGINALAGTKTDKEALENAQNGIAYYNNIQGANSYDDIRGLTAQATFKNPYTGSLFRSVGSKNRDLREQFYDAKSYAERGIENNIWNIRKDKINDYLANYRPYGGPIYTTDNNDNMSAINYGFMQDYLTNKKQEIAAKNKMAGLSSMPSFMPQNTFAIGGDLQTNGADWSDGLTTIGAGGSHEENPYEGIQLGVDSEGTPNLVEEDETVYNDYVFSNRILADETTKQMFRLPKKKDISFSDISKRLEKEIAERPNDPVSKAGFKAQMQQLEEQQERQKQEMEATRARETFEALSPDEQVAVMQQAQQEEQMAQQAAMQEEAAIQQPSPEEIAMAEQQQMAMADGSQAALGQEPQMSAEGGRINKFDKGGVLKLLNSLGYKTVAEAEKAGWKPSDFGDYSDWKEINSNTKLPDNFEWTDEFSKRLTSPELKAALSLGWNPVASLLGRKWYEGDNGNSVGWTQSYGKDAINAEEFKDYAKRYKNTLGWAVDNGLIKAPEGNGTISMADITEAMRQSPDWKKTDEWLYSNPANMASYLGMARGLNPDDDTKFINKWSPYGSFTKGDNGQWQYNLRSDLSDVEKQAFTDLFKKARTDNKVGVMYNNFSDPVSVTNRYVLDGNGNPVLLTTDDLSGYEQLGTYSWGDEPNNVNNNAIFYRVKNSTAPGTATPTTAAAVTPAGTGQETVEPRHKASWMRYAGLFGPAVGLGMQMAGIGRPNTGSIDAALRGSGEVSLANYKPIGNYLTYKPLDIWYEQNRLDANARATDRAIRNSGSNQGAIAAGLLANGYNSQIASGNLFRQAQEYNDNLRKQVEDFNRGTNRFNAEAYNRLSQFNADARNRARQANAQMRLHAAAQKADMDAGWYNGIYGNVSGLFKGLSDLGRENEQFNWLADLAADGAFGNLGKSNTGRRWIKRSASKGGKIRRKKGLTI